MNTYMNLILYIIYYVVIGNCIYFKFIYNGNSHKQQ